MAPALKLWIGSTLVGAALLSIATLPPSVMQISTLPQRLPEEVRFSTLRADASRTTALIRRMRWLDSLPALAVATARDGLAVGGDPGLVRPEDLAQTRELLRRELSQVPRGDENGVVGFFFQPPYFASAGTGFLDTRPRFELYAGRLGDTPWCLVLYLTDHSWGPGAIGPWQDASGTRHSDLLQACRIVAAHGMPGPHIRDWLARGAFRFAQRAAPPEGTAKPTTVAVRDPFGRRMYSWDRHDLTPQLCLSGTAAACGDLVLRGDGGGDDPEGGVLADLPEGLGANFLWDLPPVLTDAARYLLSDLEREYGADAFDRFWTSDEDVTAAFQGAFGESLDAWAAGWVATYVGHETYGPGLPRRATLGTTLLLLLGALAGGMWHRRRAVA